MWVSEQVKVSQCPTLCDPTVYTVHGILQARILKWVAFPFSKGSSQPGDRTQVSRIAGGFFTSWATREAQFLIFILIAISTSPGSGILSQFIWSFCFALREGDLTWKQFTLFLPGPTLLLPIKASLLYCCSAPWSSSLPAGLDAHCSRFTE